MILAAFLLLPSLQVNATTDPVGAVLEKYGLSGVAIFLMLLTARYLAIQQTKQASARQASEESERQARQDSEEADRQRQQETQKRYDDLQNEVRLQLSQQSAEAKEREITLLKDLRENAKLVAKLQVEVAVLQEQAKNYDDRIALLNLQLQVKQSDFDTAATERHKLEETVQELSTKLAVMEKAYQLLREQHDQLVIEKNALRTEVTGIKRDTQPLVAATPNPT